MSHNVARLVLVSILLLIPMPARPAGMVTTDGYVPMPDGTRLHYILYLPSDTGTFPTLFKYDQYSAGSSNTPSGETADGYAVIGVNLRGSGCSTGIDSFVNSAVWGRDGAEVVEWIARQKWSNGHVGMFGGSFPGLSQLAVAGFAPPHLDAITPEQPTVDFYRDIAYPGGIYNVGWMSEYSAFIYTNQRDAFQDGVQRADTSCGAFTQQTREGNIFSDAAINMPKHPFFDSYWEQQPASFLSNIHIPVLGCQEWQDGAVGSRTTETYFTLDPASTWFAGSNGPHGACNIVMDPLIKPFLDHFVKGVDNGFEKTPHVILGHELSGGEGLFAIGSTPRWISTIDGWPQSAQITRLFLHSDGSMSLSAPAAGEAPQSYTYPLPSSSLGVEEFSGYEQTPTWPVPDAPGGSLVFTTPALSQDMEFFGSGSIDLWVATTATDSDIQVTLTDVRADGMEQYIQRGWLRLSHRALDDARSTPTAPYHLDTEAAARPMVPGKPELVRVELMPFDHVFPAGSSLRVIVDAPTGTTFGDVFRFLPDPSENTIFTSPTMPSSVALSLVPAGRAQSALSNCLNTMDEPCRPNLVAVPQGPH